MCVCLCFGAPCLDMCTCVQVQICIHVHACGGKQRSTLDVIPWDTCTFFIEGVGYYISLGFIYLARLAALCLPSYGVTVCLTFLMCMLCSRD